MKTIKVYIEIADNGYSAYMEKNDLNYGLIGEGKTVRETIADFMDAYAEMREYYPTNGLKFEEAKFEFFYDIASFLEEYSRAFSLAGLERITGVNQTQLGHYLHGRRRPSQKTIQKIQEGVRMFADNLTAVHFA